jgi:hypothetical protein
MRRRTYAEGRSLSQFVARDVRRDIVIVSAAKLEEGILTVRMRTTNVLYVLRGLAPQPDFDPVAEVRIEDLWRWTGQSWGGLPDGTSLAQGLLDKSQAGGPGSSHAGGEDKV